MPKKNQCHFGVGSRVFAKMKGFPAWPAVVVDPQYVVIGALGEEKKPVNSVLKQKKNSLLVNFYVSNDVNWIAYGDLFDFDKSKAQMIAAAKEKQGRIYQLLREAIEVAVRDGEKRSSTAAAETPGDEDESEDDLVIAEEAPMPKGETTTTANGSPDLLDDDAQRKKKKPAAKGAATATAAASRVASKRKRVAPKNFDPSTKPKSSKRVAS